MIDEARRRLERLAAPGGSLEVRNDMAKRWAAGRELAAAEYAVILEQLLPIEAHVLEVLYEQKVELAPDDYSWQDVQTRDLVQYFGLTNEECALLADDLQRLQVAEIRGGALGLTPFGITFLQACRRA